MNFQRAACSILKRYKTPAQCYQVDLVVGSAPDPWASLDTHSATQPWPASHSTRRFHGDLGRSTPLSFIVGESRYTRFACKLFAWLRQQQLAILSAGDLCAIAQVL